MKTSNRLGVRGRVDPTPRRTNAPVAAPRPRLLAIAADAWWSLAIVIATFTACSTVDVPVASTPAEMTTTVVTHQDRDQLATQPGFDPSHDAPSSTDPTETDPARPADARPADANPDSAEASPAEQDPGSVIGSVEPPPTPTATPFVPSSPCRVEPERTFDVVDVADDDPDGGLVVHESMGIDSPVIGVFPSNARSISWWGECDFTPSGAEWWAVSGPGRIHGWVNSRYLGQRNIDGDAIAQTPCRLDATDGAPARDNTTMSALDTRPAISDIRVESTGACDRVVIEFASTWSFDDEIPRPLDALPRDAIAAIERRDGEVQIGLHRGFTTAFDSIPPGAIWRDAATGEDNVAVVLDRNDTTWLYVGWGTGSATVTFADVPARAIIDIAQAPTAPGDIVGPIVAANPYGPMLFDPISPSLEGDGIAGTITVRGFSRGFESSSYIDVRPWSQTSDEHPGAWNGALFGLGEAGPAAPLAGWAPRPDGLTFDPPLPDTAGASFTPFTTAGYFEFDLTGLEPGGWQIAVAPSSGLGCEDVVGQQFRVAGGPQSEASMVPFTLERVDIEPSTDDLVATTVTTVLGTEWIHRGRC